MFGSHLSIAGGMENALLAARDLGFESVQVFTKNQRQWQAKPLAEDQIDLWKSTLSETGIVSPVSHDSYLINLASPKAELHDKSIALFLDELDRCALLDIPFLVTHPGAHVGSGEEAGLAKIIASLDQLHAARPDCPVITCLEITAGQGTTLGHTFEHLQTILAGVAEPERLGICFDTAHAIAAGYDLTSGPGAAAMLEELDQIIGLDQVRVLHLNDSKVPRGSRVDRHEHIGHGHVHLDAFAEIVNRFPHTPKILETPKADHPDGQPWDTVNLQTLRSLIRA